MQLAERWPGSLIVGSVVVALAAAGVAVCSERAVPAADRVQFGRMGCVDGRDSLPAGSTAAGRRGVVVDVVHVPESAPIEVELVRLAPDPIAPDPIATTLATTDVTRCFHGEDRVDLLIDIAADGRVTRATHRPERPTRTSRCIAHAVRALHFPASDTAISVRFAFTP